MNLFLLFRLRLPFIKHFFYNISPSILLFLWVRIKKFFLIFLVLNFSLWFVTLVFDFLKFIDTRVPFSLLRCWRQRRFLLRFLVGCYGSLILSRFHSIPTATRFQKWFRFWFLFFLLWYHLFNFLFYRDLSILAYRFLLFWWC